MKYKAKLSNNAFTFQLLIIVKYLIPKHDKVLSNKSEFIFPAQPELGYLRSLYLVEVVIGFIETNYGI